MNLPYCPLDIVHPPNPHDHPHGQSWTSLREAVTTDAVRLHLAARYPISIPILLAKCDNDIISNEVR